MVDVCAPSMSGDATGCRAASAGSSRPTRSCSLEIAGAIVDEGSRAARRDHATSRSEHAVRLADADKGRLRAAIEHDAHGPRRRRRARVAAARRGILRVLFPELEATVDLVQETGRQHKDVWAHTKQVVRQTVRRPLVRWAALLHDIGKVPTRTFTDDGVHFHGHAEVGARMFDKVSQRFAFARDERQTIRFLVKHHLRTNQYSEQWTDSAVRRFHREMGPHMTDLLDLSRADITSKRPGRRKPLLEQISALADRVERARRGRREAAAAARRRRQRDHGRVRDPAVAADRRSQARAREVRSRAASSRRAARTRTTSRTSRGRTSCRTSRRRSATR